MPGDETDFIKWIMSRPCVSSKAKHTNRLNEDMPLIQEQLEVELKLCNFFFCPK